MTEIKIGIHIAWLDKIQIILYKRHGWFLHRCRLCAWILRYFISHNAEGKARMACAPKQISRTVPITDHRLYSPYQVTIEDVLAPTFHLGCVNILQKDKTRQ